MTSTDLERIIAEGRRLEALVDTLAAWLLDSHDRIERLEAQVAAMLAAGAGAERGSRISLDVDPAAKARIDANLDIIEQHVRPERKPYPREAPLRERDPEHAKRWDKLLRAGW